VRRLPQEGMTEKHRALVFLAHTEGVAAVARKLGVSRHIAQKMVDEAKGRVTGSLWVEGRDTIEADWFQLRGNGMWNCGNAVLRIPSGGHAYNGRTTV
jgi:hypothetical protein